MSTRQYIGARYVPKFADPIEWNVNNSYEALTIVSYLGNSYTSKKNVPVGTAITNDEYWAVTGNYNSQVEQYRQEARDCEEALNVIGNNYARKTNVILIGDSYGTENGSGSVVINPTVPQTVKDRTKLPDDRFRARFVNGSGFINGYFLDNITTVSNTMSTEEKEAVSDVMFFGGWNDYNSMQGGSTAADFNSAFAACVNYAKTNFPNAKIHVGFWSASRYAYETGLYETVMGWYKIQASLRGCSYIHNLEYVMHRRDFFVDVDYSHPSQSGANNLAAFISEYIKNGCSYTDWVTHFSYGYNKLSAEENFQVDFATPAIIFDINIANNRADLYGYFNNTNTFSIIPTTGGVPTPRTFSAGANVAFAKFTDRDMYGRGPYTSWSVPVVIYYDTDKVFSGNCRAYLNGGKLYLTLPLIRDSAGTIIQFVNTSAIYITGSFYGTFNTLDI